MIAMKINNYSAICGLS